MIVMMMIVMMMMVVMTEQMNLENVTNFCPNQVKIKTWIWNEFALLCSGFFWLSIPPLLHCIGEAHPEIFPAEIFTRSELRSGNADWDDQNFALPNGARRMNT